MTSLAMTFAGAGGPLDMAEPARDEISLAVWGPLAAGDLPGLARRLCRLVEPGITRAFLDVSQARADAVTVDALAQLQLLARRRGCQIRLRGCSPELRELVAFMGLQKVLPEN
jgi:ABC-type transporter Mla MlaB component